MPVAAIDDLTIEEEYEFFGEEYVNTDSESVAPFDLICYNPVVNYLNGENNTVEELLDETENDNVMLYNIGDTSEAGDKQLVLSHKLTAKILNYRTDGDNFKNIVNVSGQDAKNDVYLKNLIRLKYSLSGDAEVLLYSQGSCSDGEYIYYSFTVRFKKDGKTQKENCFVTGSFSASNEFITRAIRFSSDIVHTEGLTKKDDLKHINGMTYNSINDTIVMACSEKGYHNIVYSADAAYFRGDTEDLPNVESHKLSCMIVAIAYNERINNYVGLVYGSDMYFVYMDSDFNIIGSFNYNDVEGGPNNSIDVSHQGLSCDENYIYATYHKKSNGILENIIAIYNWAGEKIYEFNLDIPTVYEYGETEPDKPIRKSGYEIENINFLNDRIVLGFNVFWRLVNNDNEEDTGENTEDKTTLFYQYDLTDYCFNIKYCPDDTIEDYINNNDLRSNTVLHGYSTMTLTNTYRKMDKNL